MGVGIIAGIGELVKAHGLSATLSIIIVALLVFVLKWIFKTMNGIIESASEERVAFIDTINRIGDSVKAHTERAAFFHKQVQDAHTYQREEHQKMIRSLQSSCSMLEVMNEDMKENRRNINEEHRGMIETLGRINGYKK